MRNFKYCLTIISLLTLLQEVKSQNVLDGVYVTPKPSDAVTLFITISDYKTKLPVEDVKVEILGNDGSELNLKTDEEGKLKCLLFPYSFKFVYKHQKYREILESIKFTHAPDTLYLQKYIDPK